MVNEINVKEVAKIDLFVKGSMNLSLSGKVGIRAVIYYLSTTVLAVILGIILVVTIQPGKGDLDKAAEDDHSKKNNVTTADTLMDLLRNCFPPNIMQATMQQYRTTLVWPGDQDNVRTD